MANPQIRFKEVKVIVKGCRDCPHLLYWKEDKIDHYKCYFSKKYLDMKGKGKRYIRPSCPFPDIFVDINIVDNAEREV